MTPSSRAERTARLLRDHPYHRYRPYEDAGLLDRGAWIDREIEELAGRPHVEIAGPDGSVAAAWLHTVDGEAEVLGCHVARLGPLCTDGSDRRRSSAAAILEVLALLRARDPEPTLVILQIDVADTAALLGAQDAGLTVVEVGTTWLATPDPGRLPGTPPGLHVRVSTADEMRDLAPRATEGIVAEAAARFRSSHFHADPRIDPTRADELYRRWAQRTLDGSWSDRVISVWTDDVVVGFAGFTERTIGTGPGSVRVVGDAFSMARRDAPRGVGTALFETGLTCFDADLVEYRTQLRSTYARLFARSGRFRWLGGFHTLHGWSR